MCRTWYGLWAPKGTPQDIVARLNAAAVEALADPAVAQRLTGMGFAITSRDQQTPEALAAHHKAEIAKWCRDRQGGRCQSGVE